MQRVKKMLTDSEAQLYLGGEYRIRIINSWRPLYRPVKNSPLGFCDPWTIQKQDLVAVDRPAQDQSSEAYYVKYGAHQDYYWCSNQSQKEISIFTSWDSKPENSPPYCPHAAFKLSEDKTHDIERESIETRTIVVTKVER
ncbi:hypothetical protein ONS95_015022 [Cadophora gregata]|uniref:uncharacterized protein n=1 Tax=Cadophora gregata TaxID=51156 RepID=UPI0026DCF884|nr:uncharacterized protein ONS95_015022 [Cadophora gregata]KAK0110059.1 hypothetical protein ONS95_015022 [Cadophora gregata]